MEVELEIGSGKIEEGNHEGKLAITLLKDNQLSQASEGVMRSDNSQSELEPTLGYSNNNCGIQSIAIEEEHKSNNDRSAGRWTKKEHKLFLEALQKYGKNWEKVHFYVGTRTATQVRSHAQKYFQKIGRSSSPEYMPPDGSSRECVKEEQSIEVLPKQIVASPHKKKGNRLIRRIKRKKVLTPVKTYTLLDYTTALENRKKRKEETCYFNEEENHQYHIEKINSENEEYGNTDKLPCPIPDSFIQNKNEIAPITQEVEPNFEGFNMEFEKPLDLFDKKKIKDQEMQTILQESMQITSCEVININSSSK